MFYTDGFLGIISAVTIVNLKNLSGALPLIKTLGIVFQRRAIM
jgi:hypothetical protein